MVIIFERDVYMETVHGNAHSLYQVIFTPLSLKKRRKNLALHTSVLQAHL